MHRHPVIAVGALVLAGLLAGSAVTYASIRSAYLAVHPPVHFHANIAIYVNGARIDLSAAKYMEDVGACTVGNKTTARERTHLHNGVPDVVHVHDEHVTWADFLKNIGFYADRTRLVTDTAVYVADGANQVHFILDGTSVDDPTDTFIADDDRLLISYGSEKAADLITGQYAGMASNAEEYDHGDDPATCTGSATPGLLFWR